MPLLPEQERVSDLKWELDRAIDQLNVVNEHYAACAIWDVVGTLLITLVNERHNPNLHLKALADFLDKEWPPNS